MGRRNSFASGERGVSNVVAVTLFVGLVLIGIVVVLVAGLGTIGETNEQANIQVAEESMLQVDSALEQDSGGNTTVAFPDELEGDVTVSNDATYRLTLNDNSQCTTGSRNLSTVSYDENDQAVAYQGGGVWRTSGAGSTMVSPPDISYDEGSLSFSFVKIDGQVSTTNELDIGTNTSREAVHQRNMSLALYTDRTYDAPAPDGNLDYVCRPTEVENATLTIENSQYADAWAEWANNNYDSDLVTSTDPGSVGPGDTVTITYSLGNTSEAEFTVSDIRATRANSGSDILVTANVTNTGGLRESKTVTFDYAGTRIDEQSVGVGGGDSRRVTFRIENPGEIQTGTNTMTVAVPDDSASTSGSLELDNTGSVPSVTLDASSVPTDVPARTTPNAEVTVTNTGGMTAYEQLELREDGTTVATRSVVVGPSSSKDVAVGDILPTDESGEYTLVFSGDIAPSSEDETIDPFTVGSSGALSLENSSGPSSVEEGDTVTIEANITNNGDRERSGAISLEIQNESGDTVYGPSTQSVTLDGQIAGQETRTLTWDYTVDGGTGIYDYTITGPGIRKAGQFDVGPPPTENFIITGTSVSETTLEQGNDTTITVRVNNTGTQTAEQTVTVRNERTGELLGDWSPTLDADQEESNSWTVTADSPEFELGGNQINISTENTSSLRNIDVRSEIQTISDANGEITINEESTVRITMEGAELEAGATNRYGQLLELPSPTFATLVIENDSGTYEKELWTDVPTTNGDVNHPAAERAMQQDGFTNVYNETLQVEPNTTLALYADAYGCGITDFDDPVYLSDYTYTGIVHPDRRSGGDPTFGFRCEDAEVSNDPIVEISNETNPNNVAIYGNNEQLPAFQQASPYQVGIEGMLGSRVNDSGYLQLRPDERVFLFELSKQNARTSNAQGSGDPDYNDAVARFEVVSNTDTRTTPAEFIITDYNAPAQVTQGDDATLSVTVANIGGAERSAEVNTTFRGSTLPTNTTSPLGTGESETVTFELPTASLSTGSYQWETNANDTSGDTRSGYVTVGAPPTPTFIASAGTNDPVVDTEDTPVANITVSNTGGASDTQDVVLQIRNISNPSWRDWNSASVTLAEDGEEDIQMDLPNATGDYEFRVKTDNVTTSSLPLLVGTTNVYPETIFVRYSEYEPGSLVEETGSIVNMTVRFENDGSVGDEREVQYEITDSDGNVVFTDTSNRTVGQKALSSTAVRNVSYNVDLNPGYYNYTITVYNDTQSSSRPARVVTGGIYVRDVGDVARDPDNAPIEVDTGTITVE